MKCLSRRYLFGSALATALASVLIPFSSAQADVNAGLATGFPPYQFKHQGELTGFDVDVAQAVFAHLQETLTLTQYDWDNVVSLLRYGELDLALGMESTEVRRQYFDFSTPYYKRQTALFKLANNDNVSSVRDLIGKRISGDRHSALEAHLSSLGLRNAIRIEQADSKQDAMGQLAVGEVQAVIMPTRVAEYLAQQNGVKITPVWQPNDSTPVGIAVTKGNSRLLNKINVALTELEQSGRLQELRDRWHINR